MSRFLVNLLPIVSGGGLQNSLSLVRTLSELERESVVLCRTGDLVCELCKEKSVEHVAVASRSWFELYEANMMFPRNSTCFTLFGSPPFCTRKRWINVCGVAFSNLFYPELDFWGHLQPLQRGMKRAKDRARAWLVRQADAWVFETQVLAERAVDFGFPKDRVFHVPMAVGRTVLEGTSYPQRLPRGDDESLVLYLGAAHPNKRQHLLPSIAKELEAGGSRRIRFVTTMDEGIRYSQSVMQEFTRLGIADRLLNIGPVPPAQIGDLITQVDGMILLSALESFSNNFVEAWAMGKPLFVTDADWARSACRDGAIYLDTSDPVKAAGTIHKSLDSPAAIAEQVRRGEQVFDTYPSAAEKTAMYLDVIDRVAELGKCSKAERRQIRL